MITSRMLDDKYPNILEFTLQSDKLRVTLLNLGVTITSVVYMDSGDDVVLGYDTIEEYMRYENYFGATIGRCANRIRNGEFTMNEHDFILDKNDHGNSLHGGSTGFHTRIFKSDIVNDEICFHYVSADMEEGYPGKLDLCIHVTLVDDTLKIQYEAISNADTMINFTNHSYFALQGEGNGDVDKQIVKTSASLYGINDTYRLATGVLDHVENTPFDFRMGKAIGEHIYDNENKQIRFANGYDHYMRFEKNKHHYVELMDKTRGHRLLVETDLPGFHFYVPDYSLGHRGKSGKLYKGHCAVCLETSFLPDAIHSQEQPETLLKKDHLFTSETTYRFD